MEQDNTPQEDRFMVVLLGIVFDPEQRKILIGKREKDPYIENLSWSFPSKQANPDENLEESLKKGIKEKTGYNAEILGSVFSRIPQEKKDLVLIYYLAEVSGGEEKPGEDFAELQWVSPEEIENYLTTSVEPTLKEYIESLK